MSEGPLYWRARNPGRGRGCGPVIQGYLAHKKHPPPWHHHRYLGIGLLYSPTGGRVLMSEVPLYVAAIVVVFQGR